MDTRPPQECRTLEEIRQEIDRIDRGIIRAIGERKQYVMAAAGFKKNPGEVAAPERFAAMLEVRRQWAEEEGLSPEVVERVYRELVVYFIAEEQERWAEKAGQEGDSS